MGWENYSRIEGYDIDSWDYEVKHFYVFKVWDYILYFQDYDRNFQDFFDFEVDFIVDKTQSIYNFSRGYSFSC